MKTRLCAIFLLLALLCSCGPRVIPARKFSRILEDMLLSDAWLKQNGEFATQADTMLFYDAVLERYGYSFEDYDTTVKYYCEHTEEFSKLLEEAKARVKKEQNELRNAIAADTLADESGNDALPVPAPKVLPSSEDKAVETDDIETIELL